MVLLAELPAMKRWLFIIGIVSATACGPAHQAAAESRFCIPDAYAVPNVAWAPPETQKSRDVAFRGCRASDKACRLPSEIRNGVIEPDDRTGWKWEQFAPDAFYRRVATEGSPALEPLDDGTTIVVTNTALTRDWYVWRKSARDGKTNALLADGDELVAVCRNQELTEPGQAPRPAVVCNRYTDSADYGLHFTFESQTRIPQEIEKLDSGLRAVIDAWRCGAK